MNDSFFSALINNPFLQNAVIAGLLAAIASGIMGSYVVAKKITSISGSISHSILGGIGIAIFINYKYQISFDPLLGAFIAAIVSALLMGWVHLKHAHKEDAAIAAIWSTGMALGVIFMSQVPSYGADFTHFLFGNILLVSKANLYMLFGLDLALLGFVAIFYRHFFLICFDEELAFLQKINVQGFYLLLLSLISVSIVLLIQIIGIILVIALLSIPPTIATIFAKRLSFVMIIASILSAFFIFLGTALSYEFNFPPGATIALVAAIFYVLCLLNKKF
jgi:zinc transport system permease protein